MDAKNIGSNRQLFVDHYWIDHLKGVVRKLHQPVRQEIVIESDKPWDQSPSAAGFIQDGDKFKAWYRTDQDFGQIVRPGVTFKYLDPPSYPDAITAYAESEDGIQWKKPNLGIFEINGSRSNNAVWMGPGANMVPFKDPNPDVSSEETFKAVVRTSDLLALGSPDGLKWHLIKDIPISKEGPFDSINVSFWDDSIQKYVIYARGIGNPDDSAYYDRTTDSFKAIDHSPYVNKKKGHEFGGGVRWIRRATSDDFRNWSDFELIDTGEIPDEHLYTNSCIKYERAPGMYLMFPSRYVIEHTPDSKWARSSGVNDIVFMSSRDGLNFDRSFKEAFIRPGLDINNWHDRGVYLETGILQTSPSEISLYGMENSHLPSQRIRRFTLRTDGFVSVNAGYYEGEFVTIPFRFSGSELELNYSTSATGFIKAEILDVNMHPVKGFRLTDCVEKFGDEISGVVNWREDIQMSTLAGKIIRIKFFMKDADLYAFRFR